jgi:hypothetical protein
MKAIFQAVRTSDVNHLKPDLSRPKPKTLLKANLASEVLPPSQTELGIGGYSGANASAATSSSSTPAVSTGGNTSANKPVQRNKDIQQLKLDTVEQNLTKRRQNARIIEDETKVEFGLRTYIGQEQQPARPAPKQQCFGDGHISTRDEIQRALADLTGSWKIHARGSWLSRSLSWYLRGGVADYNQPYRPDGFVKVKQVLEQVRHLMPYVNVLLEKKQNLLILQEQEHLIKWPTDCHNKMPVKIITEMHCQKH